MVVPEVSWDQVRRFRLARHHLLDPAPNGTLAEVVHDICGVQAQVAVSAALALRARIHGLTREDVRRALASESGPALVKTWCMRGTVHLFDADSLSIYLGAVGNAVTANERRWMAKDGLTPEKAQAIVDLMGVALSDGPLTRREVSDHVRAALGEDAAGWVADSWGGVMKQACLAGVACFGSDRGVEVTFSLLKEWLPSFIQADPNDAADKLLTRYLRCYGPATAADFASWAGLRAREAKSAVERLAGAITQVAVPGLPSGPDSAAKSARSMIILRNDLEELARGNAARTPERPYSVRLLPSFDQFLLAHTSKDWLVDRAHYDRVFRKAGWISPVVLVDGRIAGVWSHKTSGGRIKVNVGLFDDWGPGTAPVALTADNPLLQQEVGDVERFLSGAGRQADATARDCSGSSGRSACQ